MSAKEPTGRGGGGRRSNAYASTVATQSDVIKYRGKYKELKAKNKEIEMENDAIHLKTLNVKRTIQRMRLERAILYERLEAAPDPIPLPRQSTKRGQDEEGKADDVQRDASVGGDTFMDVDDGSEMTSTEPNPTTRTGNGIKVTLRRNAPNGS